MPLFISPLFDLLQGKETKGEAMHVEERERKREKTNRIPLVSCGLIGLFFSFFFKPRRINSFFLLLPRVDQWVSKVFSSMLVFFYLISNYDRLLLFYSCLDTMSSDEGSQSSNSQAPLYMFGGSYAYRKRFIANMYHITHEAQFQRWRS